MAIGFAKSQKQVHEKQWEQEKLKFQKYLRLIFKDLLAKDNGLTDTHVRYDVFFKYVLECHMSHVLINSLYNVLCQFTPKPKQEGSSPLRDEENSKSRIRQEQDMKQEEQKQFHDDRSGGHKVSPKEASSPNVQQQQSQENSDSRIERGFNEEAFIEVFSNIYFGNELNTRDIVFRLLDVSQ
ncbi:hypothetical protein FGO68_gene1567 [Halteria grandinella]|uniref:Uncharacterized protein n=1 Tax=Halteria grandinella TaxID=5974 RepID=A0A8J8NH96_HALGN|nr:hypothetical protein FGO68_gene1567 [Halteria grandinella]